MINWGTSAGLKLGLLATSAVVAVSGPACAQTKTFDVPAQAASTGVAALARQADVQVLIRGADAAGRRTNAVRGAFTVDQALSLLLAGTGLRAQATGPQTWAVVIADAPDGARAEGHAALSEVLVTGSRLAPTKSETTPVTTYSDAAIKRSGQVSISGFLNSLPEVSVGASPDNWTNLGGQTTVRLRGLPAGATLVLLDGRRIAPSAILGSRAAFDLNTIGPDLVERIDIVPVGSSAVYGSDAIGGVVNVVLRKRVDGVAGSASQSFADDFRTTSLSLGLGHSFERGSISLMASYRRQDRLTFGDRGGATDFRRYAAQGGQDRRATYCEPGTVTAVSGTLNGLGVATAGVPAGTSPTLTVNDFRATAGAPNLCDSYAHYVFFPKSEGVSTIGQAEYALTDSVTAYAQVFYSDYRTDPTSPTYPIAWTVPATNAFNPFGQTVRVTSVVPVRDSYPSKDEVLRPLVGLRGRLGDGWTWDVAGWRSDTRDKLSQVVVNAALRASLLASSDPAQALNPFRPGATSRALLDQIYPTQASPYHVRQYGADAVLRGTLLDLPAGPVSAAVGWEGGKERSTRSITVLGQTAHTAASRNTSSLFGEARVPLLPGADAEAPLLQAGVAGRYDRYSDFGGTVTPQASVEFRPLSQLSMRASYSEAFKAPTLLQLFDGKTGGGLNRLVDPMMGRKEIMAATYVGGNPELDPETGASGTFSVTWREPTFHNLRLTATVFRIEQKSRIIQASSQTILDFEDLFPGRVVRAAPIAGATLGEVVSVDSSFVNFGGLRLTGVDLSAGVSFPLGGGTLTPTLAATRTLKYTSQIAPGTPFADRLAKATAADVWAPRWKATLGATWSAPWITAGLQGRYVSRYLDYQSPVNGNRLGDYWTVDGSLEADLNKIQVVGQRLPEGFYARVAVSNLLDRGPKFSNYGDGYVGFDASMDDVIGRNVTVTVGRRF